MAPSRALSRGTLIAIALLSSPLAGCGDGVLGAPDAVRPPQSAVRLIAGDRQFGDDGRALSEPLVVEARSLAGTPLPNVEVLWRVNDGGTITPSTSRTDANGRAEAVWTLGVNEDHEGSVRIAPDVAAAFSASEPPSRLLELHEVGIMRPRTFDGSRQTVHPDFARTPSDWSAYALHLALTPYPNSDVKGENPSLYVSRLGYRWFPEAGLTNPVVRPSAGYLSDPDLVYVPERRELWMYYRQADTKNRVYLVRSRDGLTWSAPEQVLEAVNHSVVSPAIVRQSPTNWYLWSVNGGEGGCSGAAASVEVRRSRDGIHWGRPVPADLRGDTRMPWHLDVQWIPELKQFWALYPVKRPYTCATQSLYLATSTDGVSWTNYPSPILEAGEIRELSDIVYRSTFEYDASTDELRFWFSGAVWLGALDYDWRTVQQRRPRREVLSRIASTAALSTYAPARHAAQPPQLQSPP